MEKKTGKVLLFHALTDKVFKKVSPTYQLKYYSTFSDQHLSNATNTLMNIVYE